MRVTFVATMLAIAALFWMDAPVRAEGNLASRPERLETLLLGADLSFSVKEYLLETGEYYRWRIESQGGEEFMLRAPDLFRNAWIEQVVINDVELHPGGGFYGIEFDDEGIADVWFVPIRPGNFDYFISGFESRGMSGTFVVR
ncbi:MAG: hypothetical protein VCB82_13900 [Alphaproteobacteria bacterium]